jgi:FkbM family methyltransferase
MFTTKTKIKLAGVAYKLISGGRWVLGKSDSVIANRHGIRYHLDLKEGIDFSVYLLGAFERGTRKTLQDLVKSGDTIFDIGANVGAHTLTLAQAAGPLGRVFAFEPSHFAFHKLCRNLALNPELQARACPQQILFQSAVAEPATKEIYASWPLESAGAVHPKHRGRLVSTSGALVDTVDSFVARQSLSRLDLIKIDVDGHELPVFQGACATLERFRPLLVMEMSPYVHAENRHSFADFVELLRKLDYALTDTDTHQAVPLNATELERLIPDGASMNVVGRSKVNG